MFRPLVLVSAAALALIPAASSAQSQAESGQPPQRIRQVTLTGEEKCPTAASDEIVVCSRLDPNEQFRVPKALRQAPEVPAQNQSWVNRAATVDQVGRVAGGLPNTCSAVGAGGQTGCAIVAGRAWAAEKRQERIEAAQAAPEARTDIDIEDEPRD
jgi:hypothetical protein